MSILSPKRIRRSVLAFIVSVTISLGLLYLYAENLDDYTCRGSADPVFVVKSKVDLRKGNVLRESQVESVAVPRRFLPPNPMLEPDVSKYVGKTLNHRIEKGAMILTTDFDR